MAYVVYKATSPSGKSYVGYTSKSLNERIKRHFKSVRDGVNRPFTDALRKYGKSIKWEILCTYEVEEYALNRERYFIKKYKTLLTENGYNYTIGGEGRPGPINVNKYSRKVIDNKGNIFNSFAQAGKSVGATSGEVFVGIKDKSLVRGVSFSLYEEGMQLSPTYKCKRKSSVYCFETQTTYESCAAAARELKVSPQSVHLICSGKAKTSKGYSFRFEEKRCLG